MFALLSGLRGRVAHITAIVTVTDDGGSSGILRTDLDIPPPGDVRNCLLALSDADPLLIEALDWRFDAGELEGHSLGNLLIAAATFIKGDFAVAVRELHRVLKIQGAVIPSSPYKVGLVAHHEDGTRTAGEVRISRSGRPIRVIELRPEPPPISADIRAAIASADLFVFGPGSLFTSVIPNLLIPGMREAVAARTARRIYVANIMTQPGETDGYTLSDHVAAFQRHAGPGFLHAVIASKSPIAPDAATRYKLKDAEPVILDQDRLPDVDVVTADLADAGGLVRHHPARLAQHLIDTFWRNAT